MDPDDPGARRVVLWRGLLPAALLGLYFAGFDVVGTLVGVVQGGPGREAGEFVRRVVADFLSGLVLLPLGLVERWLRPRPRSARDLAAAVVVVVLTAPLIVLTAAGADYASSRRGAGTDVRLLEAMWGDLAPVLPEVAVGALALALPAGVCLVLRLRGVRLRWQVALSAAAGLVQVATYRLVIPGLLPRLLRGQPELYEGAMLLVSCLAPLLVALSDRVERRLVGADPERSS